MKPVVGLVALLSASVAFAQLGAVPGGGTSNVRWQPIAQGNDATTSAPGLFAFNDPVSWGNYWQANHRGPAPFLEQGFFSQWRLVAIHAGSRPGTGYNLGVLRIDRHIDRATISALETVPPRGRSERSGRSVTTSPWILLRVERGAYDFALQTRQVQGYVSGAQTVNGGSSVKVGGATVTFGPGYCPPK